MRQHLLHGTGTFHKGKVYHCKLTKVFHQEIAILCDSVYYGCHTLPTNYY